MERELVTSLNEPSVRYMDLLTMDFDHAAHHNNDRESHLATLHGPRRPGRTAVDGNSEESHGRRDGAHRGF